MWRENLREAELMRNRDFPHRQSLLTQTIREIPCCRNFCWLAIVLWCWYCLVSYFLLRCVIWWSQRLQHQETTEKSHCQKLVLSHHTSFWRDELY